MKRFIKNYIDRMMVFLALLLLFMACIAIPVSVIYGLGNYPAITIAIVFLLGPVLVQLIERS